MKRACAPHRNDYFAQFAYSGRQVLNAVRKYWFLCIASKINVKLISLALGALNRPTVCTVLSRLTNS